jgi:hypothetical protein
MHDQELSSFTKRVRFIKKLLVTIKVFHDEYMKKYTQSGSAMLNAIVVGLILTVGVIVVQKSIEDSKKASRSAKSRDAIETLHDMLSGLMQNQENCNATLRAVAGANPPVNGSTIAVPHIRDINNNTIFSVHTGAFDLSRVYVSNSVTIKSMNFIMPTALGGNATFDVTYERHNPDPNVRTKTGYGAKQIKKTLPIVFQRDTSNNYNTCYAVESGITDTNLATYCEQFGELFYWDNTKKACLLKDNRCNNQIFVGINADGSADCRNLENWADLSPLFDTTTTHPCDPAYATDVRFVYNAAGRVSLRCYGNINCTASCPAASTLGPNFTFSSTTGIVANWTSLSGHSSSATTWQDPATPANVCYMDVRASTACDSSGQVIRCNYSNSANTGCTSFCSPPTITSVNPNGVNSFSVSFTNSNPTCNAIGIAKGPSPTGPWTWNHSGCSSPRTESVASAGTWYWTAEAVCSGTSTSGLSNTVCTPATPCSTIAASYCPSDPTQNDSCGNNCGVGTKSSGCVSTSTQCTLLSSGSTTNCGNGIILLGSNSYNTRDASNNVTGTCSTTVQGCASGTIGSISTTCPGLTNCPTACNASPTCTTLKATTCNGVNAGSDNCGNTCGNGTLVVNGNWSAWGAWGAWGPCSVLGQTRSRSRTCTDPPPSCGGATCPGSATEDETQACALPGKCQGSGSDPSLWIIGTNTPGNPCTNLYRYQDFSVDPSKFAVGNIYSITRGQTVSVEALPGDTPLTMLNRLATSINGANISASGSCSSFSYNYATVIAPNTIRHRVQYQHVAGVDASRSCNGLLEAACNSTLGCNWNTTGPSICTGLNHTVPQGTCNGTYYISACKWDGFGTAGSNDVCYYSYSTQADCDATPYSLGCRWGPTPMTCYASTQAACLALGGGGCSWQTYPSIHRSCTQTYYGESTCNSYNPPCTWTPL